MPNANKAAIAGMLIHPHSRRSSLRRMAKFTKPTIRMYAINHHKSQANVGKTNFKPSRLSAWFALSPEGSKRRIGGSFFDSSSCVGGLNSAATSLLSEGKRYSQPKPTATPAEETF